MEVHPSVLTYR
ncbi:hypothetical protein OXX69_005000, partial [Metschnikowia pulcherrima]